MTVASCGRNLAGQRDALDAFSANDHDGIDDDRAVAVDQFSCAHDLSLVERGRPPATRLPRDAHHILNSSR
jgi:hypothetical protein